MEGLINTLGWKCTKQKLICASVWFSRKLYWLSNILQCALPPQSVCQTFLSVFLGGSGDETKYMCSVSDARYI